LRRCCAVVAPLLRLPCRGDAGARELPANCPNGAVAVIRATDPKTLSPNSRPQAPNPTQPPLIPTQPTDSKSGTLNPHAAGAHIPTTATQGGDGGPGGCGAGGTCRLQCCCLNCTTRKETTGAAPGGGSCRGILACAAARRSGGAGACGWRWWWGGGKPASAGGREKVLGSAGCSVRQWRLAGMVWGRWWGEICTWAARRGGGGGG